MTFEADIAVIELAQRVTFDRYKQPVALAYPGVELSGLEFNGTGWGTLRERGDSSQRLRRVVVPFVPDEECGKIYSALSLTTVKVREGMICAGKNSFYMYVHCTDGLKMTTFHYKAGLKEVAMPVKATAEAPWLALYRESSICSNFPTSLDVKTCV